MELALLESLFPFGDPMILVAHTPHKEGSSKITFGLTLCSGERSLSAQPFSVLSQPFLLRPQEFLSTFIFHPDGPAQADICELTQIKENENLV